MRLPSILTALRSIPPLSRALARGLRARRNQFKPGLETLDERVVPALTPITFGNGTATSLAVGSNPQAIVTADFNGDGKLDLATANAGDNSVSVVLGDGAGGFGAATAFETGSGPISLAVGDFNKDGKLDLVTANSGGTGVSVLLGNGSGGFGAAQSVALGAGAGTPRSVAVGDFNADGKMDLAVTSSTATTTTYWWYGPYTTTTYEGKVTVLIGNGSGGFSTQHTTDLGDRDPSAIAVADFNKDGKLDVATTNENWGSVSVLMGSGTGTLGTPVEYLTGWYPKAVSVGDFTGDGKTDLVTVGQSVDVLPGFGDGTFQDVRQQYFDPVAVAVADFNGDGKLDVATADPTTGVATLLGRGNGTFTLSIAFPAGSQPSAVVAADFNGDGKIDLAAANGGSNDLSVFLNNGVWPALDAPSVSVNDVTVTEGNSGTTNATFTLTLSAAYTKPVTISYATGTGVPYYEAATPGTDYAAVSGQVTIPAGQRTATVSVPVYGDRVGENWESFALNLTEATNAFIADAQGVGSIIDDEPIVSMSYNWVEVVEGNSGKTAATFTVVLSQASDTPVTVDYTTADPGMYWYSATAGVDFEVTSGTVTFAPGQTTRTITVNVLGDRLPEYDETFAVSLTSAAGARISYGTGYGVIRDDEPRVSISSPGYVTEGNTGTKAVTFTVSLSAASPDEVRVNYSTAEGDTEWYDSGYWGWYGWYAGAPEPVAATAGTDFQSKSGTLIFAPGETQKTVTVLVNGDRIAEADEAFSVDLRDPTGALIGSGHAVVTILDDEPWVSVSDTTVTEGTGGTKTANFTVTLSSASDAPVTVKYSTADGYAWYGNAATAGSDYEAAAAMLTFAPGETTKTVSIKIYTDSVAEYQEYFSLNLSDPVGARLGTNTAIATIVDDDPHLTVNNVSKNEGASGVVTSYTFTVSLSVASTSPVTVKYATQDGSATAGSDYQAKSGTLTFAPGELTKTVTVSVYGDTTKESDEYFYLFLSNPTGNALIYNAYGTGQIINDDASISGGKGKKR